MTVETAAAKIYLPHKKNKLNVRWVLKSIPLHKVTREMTYGPALFQPQNLFAATDGNSPPPPPHHSWCELLLGTAHSFTPLHCDFFGADGYVQLVEGAKVWIYGPPESREAMEALYNTSALPVTKLRISDAEAMLRHGIRCQLQQKGELIYMPGGWPHAVKNLTPTIAFGGSYLRACHLDETFRWMDTQIHTAEDFDVFHIDLFHRLELSRSQPYWGIDPTLLDEFRAEGKKRAERLAAEAEREIGKKHKAAAENILELAAARPSKKHKQQQ